MQITLSSQQSKVLESLSQQGGYASLEDAIERCQSLGMRLSRQRRYILDLDHTVKSCAIYIEM